MKKLILVFLLLYSLTNFAQDANYVGYSRTFRRTSLIDKPSISDSKIITKIPAKKEFKVWEYAGELNGYDYYKIEYNGIIGYVNAQTIEITKKMYKAKNAENNNKEELARRTYLEGKYEKFVASRIFNKSVWIGMTKEMAIDSWGAPSDINKTIGEWGTHEQWVYKPNDAATKILLDAGMDVSDIYVPERLKKTKYLYFENDKLTSIQE